MTGFRGKLKWDGKKFVPAEKRKKLDTAPVVKTDEIPPTKSHCDFNSPTFTSSTKLRAYEAERGFVTDGGEHIGKGYVETAAEREKREHEEAEAIKKDIMDVKYNRVEFTDREKQLHEEENRRWGTLKNPY